MNISRRSFLAGAAGLLSALASLDLLAGPADGLDAGAASPALTLPPLALRGYGTLSATHRALRGGQASLTHVTCQSPAKAHLVQAKYLSDLGLLPGTEEGTLAVGGHSVPIRRTSAGGAVACYARGNDVLIFAAASEEGLKEVCAATLPAGFGAADFGAADFGAADFGAADFGAADFGARVPVPMWLDRWDRHGLMSYYGPGQTPATLPPGQTGYDVNTDLRFAKDHDLGLVLWTNALIEDTGEGMTDAPTWDYMQQGAKRMGVPMHINLQNSWPVVWLANRYRDETQLKAPQFLGGFYGTAGWSLSLGALSWNSQAGEDALLGVMQEDVRRFAADPNIVGWLEPHAETAETPQAMFLEYGPVSDKTMREFLMERYGSLQAVSERWHGDPHRLKSWADVRVPEIAEFAGFGPDAIDLRGTWRVKYVAKPDGHAYTLDDQYRIPSPPPTAPIPAEWYGPGFDDSGWDEFVAPGNDRMLTIPRSPLVYRRTVDVSAEWLASHPTVMLYVWDMSRQYQDEMPVYVNGQKVPGQPWNGYSLYDVTHALQAGLNHLAMNVPRGILCYRMYLTGEKPAQFPDLGPHRNAQWVDFIKWHLWSRKAQMARGVEMIRQVDPNSSINFMAVEYVSPFKVVAQEYGCRFHDTGAMAGFWTDEPSLMMAGIRFPTSAEPGSPAPDAAQFQAFFGRWITEGVNGVHYFQTLGDIQWNPEALRTFEANRGMYHAIGKYHVPFAEVGILFSTTCQQIAGFPWDADHSDKLGRSDYYHGPNPGMYFLDYCPRAGLTEDDFGTGNVSPYRMIVDCNTMFMSKKLVDDVEAYVRGGGVFVTNGQTGRHDEVHPDAWPISRLTGYRVLNPNRRGHTAGAPGQTVLTDPQVIGSRDNGGQSLKKVADCQDLLLWDDGSTAVGMRPLGKGWVVHVGAPGDSGSVMRQLAAHFGVKRLPATYTPAPGLHFRHFIGNTGLQDIWVLFNESPSAVTTALTFLPGVRPASLTDLLTGAAVPVTRGDGTGGDKGSDSVPGIALHPWQTVMYVSPRADVAGSPLEWLELQRGWWQGTKTPPARRLPTRAEMQRFTLDLTGGWAYKRTDGLTDDQVNALALPSVDDHAWERRTLDVWLDPGPAKPQRILLRRTFTVPAHWTAGTILLCDELQGGAFVAEGRTYLDGKLIADARWLGEGLYDESLSGVLKPGATLHVALDVRSPTTVIGVRAPFLLTYDPDPLGRQDLSGEWQGYTDEMHSAGPIQLPGRARNLRFVSRSVVIDRAHAGRNVVIYARSSAGELIRGLLFNGRRLDPATVGYGRHDLIINVTPMVNFGAENTVEFLFNSTPEGTGFEAVEIRYYAKGFYP